MELIDSMTQLVAVVGYNEAGGEEVIAICTPNEVKRTAQVILDPWPDTVKIAIFALTLSAEPKQTYTREEVAAM